MPDLTPQQPAQRGPVAPHGPHSPSDAPEGPATQDRATQSRTDVPRPAPDDALREQYAAAVRAELLWTHADDVATSLVVADAVLAVHDRRMEQLAAGRERFKRLGEDIERARGLLATQVDQLTERLGQYADRAIANGERAEQAEAERDQAYRERAHLLAWLAALHPANAVITPAPDIDEPGWQLLYLLVGGWQMSWHIHPRDAQLFAHVEHVSPRDRAQWDGHTTEQKYERLQELVGRLRQTDTTKEH